MPLEDEIKRMRRDVEDIGDWVDAITQRLDTIERELGKKTSREASVAAPGAAAEVTGKPVVTADDVRSFAASRTATEPPPPPVERVVQTPSAATPQGPQFVTTAPGWADLPIERFFKERIETIRKKTQEFGWEVLLGTYWLPRIRCSASPRSRSLVSGCCP